MLAYVSIAAKADCYRSLVQEHYGRLGFVSQEIDTKEWISKAEELAPLANLPTVSWWKRTSQWVLESQTVDSERRSQVDALLYTLAGNHYLRDLISTAAPTLYLQMIALKLQLQGEPYRVRLRHEGQREIEIGPQRPDLPLSGLAASVASDGLSIRFKNFASAERVFTSASFKPNVYRKKYELHLSLEELFLPPMVAPNAAHELEHFKNNATWAEGQPQPDAMCVLKLLRGEWRALLGEKLGQQDSYSRFASCNEVRAYVQSAKKILNAIKQMPKGVAHVQRANAVLFDQLSQHLRQAEVQALKILKALEVAQGVPPLVDWGETTNGIFGFGTKSRYLSIQWAFQEIHYEFYFYLLPHQSIDDALKASLADQLLTNLRESVRQDLDVIRALRAQGQSFYPEMR